MNVPKDKSHARKDYGVDVGILRGKKQTQTKQQGNLFKENVFTPHDLTKFAQVLLGNDFSINYGETNIMKNIFVAVGRVLQTNSQQFPTN